MRWELAWQLARGRERAFLKASTAWWVVHTFARALSLLSTRGFSDDDIFDPSTRRGPS
jgi:hypothetical protein